MSFDNKIKSKFIIKQQPDSLCLSTIESVYTVINLLKESDLEQCDTKGFLLPFEKMIEYQVESILNPNNKNYHPTARREITPKTMRQCIRKTQIEVLFMKQKLSRLKNNMTKQ